MSIGILLLALAVAQEADCPAMDLLDKGARLGTLSEHAVGCLEQIVSTGEDVDRLRASKLLIAHSFTSGSRTEWARHAAHHLKELDPDDPDISLGYASHLMSFGAPAEAIRYAQHALEHRYAWDNREDGPSQLYEALSVRTQAAQKAQAALPEDHPALEGKAVEARVRLYAIEWLAHASRTDKDPTEALQACVDTGWDADRCRERAAGLEL